MKNIKKNKKLYLNAFTLVELIVVIVILAILATIAFLSFNSYSASSRDSVRLSDTANLKRGLELYYVGAGTYMFPDSDSNNSGILTGTVNGYAVAYRGVIGDTISRAIKISKTPVDPLNNSQNYVYGVSYDKKYYQIGLTLESSSSAYDGNVGESNSSLVFGSLDSSSLGLNDGNKFSSSNSIFSVGNLSSNLGLINGNVYADSNNKAKVGGNYLGMVKFSTGGSVYISNIPSLIYNFSGTTTNLLSNSAYFVYNNKSNLPYATSNGGGSSGGNGINNVSTDTLLKDITNYTGATLTGVNITGVTQSTLQTVFTTDLLKSFNTSSLDTSNVLNTNVILENISKVALGTISVNYAPCSLSGTTVAHGGNITAYSEYSIVWNAGYDCSNRSITRTCNNGVLDGSGVYMYDSCIKGVVNNCSANSSYIKNGHTYSIPALNHSSGSTNILSSNVSENNGVFRYTLSNIECNDGLYINSTESATPSVVSCNSGYSQSGNSCVVNSCNSTTPSNATLTVGTPAGINQARQNTNAGNACYFSCSSGYSWNGSSCAMVYASCNATKTALPASTDGVYWIDPDGVGGNAAFQVYCDMTTDGGGWTLVIKSNTNDDTFKYTSSYWTDDNLLNQADLTLNLATSKYSSYSLVSGTKFKLNLASDKNNRIIYTNGSTTTSKALFSLSNNATATFDTTNLNVASWTYGSACNAQDRGGPAVGNFNSQGHRCRFCAKRIGTVAGGYSAYGLGIKTYRTGGGCDFDKGSPSAVQLWVK